MTNYEVGDTVEELNPDGEVEDTGVVTKIEEYAGTSPVVYKVWAAWEVDKHELHFPSDNHCFRIKTKRPSDREITLETVSKVLDALVDCVGSSFLPTTISNCAEIVYQQIQKEQQELQRQNDPEYQKYLELKKKFETA